MRLDETSLDPWCRGRSFYDKCGARQFGDAWVLRSYDTLFAAAYGGRIVLTSEMPWSDTTRRHVEAFAKMAGAEWHGVRWAHEHVPEYSVESDDPETVALSAKRYIVNRMKGGETW